MSDAMRILLKQIRARMWSDSLQRRLLAARNNLSRPRSVLFFTTHKCASTFVSGPLFKTLLRESQYRHVDYGRAIWYGGNKLDPGGEYENFFSEAYSDLFSLNGNLYGPQRRFFDFPGRPEFRHIFFLRDPRDVLISSFYSEAFTHPVPPSLAAQKRLSKSRASAKEQSLDEYVLENAQSWIKPLYSQYRAARESATDSLYLPYDLFIQDTEQFIVMLANFLGIRPRPARIDALVRSADPVQKTEVLKHKRSGRSGQYLEKLSPETVRKLNLILADALNYWEFSTGNTSEEAG